MADKRKVKKLTNLNVQRVALVDVPAVQGSEYLIAKSLEGGTIERPSSIVEEEHMEETTSEVTTGGATDVTPTATPTQVQPQLFTPTPVTPSEETQAVSKALSMEQQRAIFYAITTIEDANFYDMNGGEPEPMPKAVMDAVKALRVLLGDRVAKKLERETKQAATDTHTQIVKELEPHVTALDLNKEGTTFTKGAVLEAPVREQMTTLMQNLGKGIGAVVACLQKTGSDIETRDKELVNLLTVCQELLVKMETATGLTADEEAQRELEQLHAREEALLQQQLRSQFEAMGEDEFRAYLTACSDEERAQTIAFLNEEPEAQGVTPEASQL